MSKRGKKLIIILLSIFIFILLILSVNFYNSIIVNKSISKILDDSISSWDKYMNNTDKLINEPIGITKYSGPWITTQNEFENNIKKIEEKIYNKGFNNKIILKANNLFNLWNLIKPNIIDLNKYIITLFTSIELMENIESTNVSFIDIINSDLKGKEYSMMDSYNVSKFVGYCKILKDNGDTIKNAITELNNIFKNNIKFMTFLIILFICLIIISLITISVIFGILIFKKEKNFFD